MAQPTNRKEFAEHCLRKLGKPVVEINVSEEQVEDRVDEALKYYADYHFDGSEHTYMKHQVTQVDKDNRYITIPENIIGVVNIFDIGDGYSSSNMFSVRYQMALNDLWDLTNHRLQNYTMAMQHISLIEELLIGKQPIRYNRHVNKLHIDMDWDRVVVGNFIVAEVYSVVDPAIYTDVWKDRWLQNYAAALIQEQWGVNLTKFSDMQLPGGVRFNGTEILQRAREKLEKLESEMINSYSLPVGDLMG